MFQSTNFYWSWGSLTGLDHNTGAPDNCPGADGPWCACGSAPAWGFWEQLLEAPTNAVRRGTDKCASSSQPCHGLRRFWFAGNVVLHPIWVKTFFFFFKKHKNFPWLHTFWMALLTICTHSTSCRDPIPGRGQRHMVIYRIPSPRTKTETNTDLPQNKQFKSYFILLKCNPKLTQRNRGRHLKFYIF